MCSSDLNLMRIFASERVAALMQKLGMQDGEAIEHPWVNKAIENAQRKVEGHNFDIRKNLLEYDDVANDQRKVVYEQRAELMSTDDVSEMVKNIRIDVVGELISEYIPPGSLDELWDVAGLEKALEASFGMAMPVQQWLDEDHDLHEESLRQRIFDELEQGIKVIDDPALQAQNIAFLQMLSEFSNRSRQVTLFASIYSTQQEPGSTLKRVPRCVVQFDNARDQGHIILHRLFENYKQFDRTSILPVLESYVQLWNRHTPVDQEELKAKFKDTYPFSPSLMEIILKKIPARGGFQNVRGALAFLGNLIRLTHIENDIITPSDVSLEDKATTIMLKDLDLSGDLINRAKENMEDLDRKSTRLNSSHTDISRMPSSA